MSLALLLVNVRENNPMHSRSGVDFKGEIRRIRREMVGTAFCAFAHPGTYPAAGSALSGGALHGRSDDANPINRPWM